jgi:hypothetical protein
MDDTATYAELETSVEIYVYDMIAGHLSSRGFLPGNISEYNEFIEDVMERGLMGSDGIATVTLTQFLGMNRHILECVSNNVYDDVFEVVELYRRVEEPTTYIDPLNLNEVCKMYLRAYLFNNSRQIREYFRTMCNLMIYLPPSNSARGRYIRRHARFMTWEINID